MREDFHVTIEETSRELTAKERVALKDTSSANKLADMTKDGSVIIDVDAYAILKVHNEHSENKDYYNYLFLDKDGNTYYSSSKPLFDSFLDIYEEMKDSDEEWKIEVYRLPSKNQSGDFLTCKII